jgi:anti-sigma factor RsiW
MFTGHVSRQLAAHLDGQLAQAEARHVELHLRQCARCRAESEEVRLGMALAGHLPTIPAPEAIWSSIQTQLRSARSNRTRTVLHWRWALAAIVVLALAAGAYWRLGYSQGTRWQVVWLEGRGAGRISAGQWLETDAKSRARVEVGAIGSVEVAPNTRVRVVTTRPDDHRLALTRGEIRAKISAPPKLFFVDTAAGTAVDLGCEYDLSANDLGRGVLRVTKGWVSYQWKGTESLVPAGASCRTRPKAVPGIPYFDDAPDRLKKAVDAFAFDNGGTEALRIVLSEARVRDTLTLWHLLSRVSAADRGRVFDRIAALASVPSGVSREQVLKLDPPTLNLWREDLAWKW